MLSVLLLLKWWSCLSKSILDELTCQNKYMSVYFLSQYFLFSAVIKL